MQKRQLIKGVRIINEGQITEGDVLIYQDRIEKIGKDLSTAHAEVIDGAGKLLMPGVIDDQVHFREPGLTHKADIYTEAKSAVAGGITSYMEMPNVKPPTVTNELLEEKYAIGTAKSLANYSFYLGATNDNAEEVKRVDGHNVCGVKIFMGSSTGNMLVDNEKTLETIFASSPILIATHCEDEATVRANTEAYIAKFGDDIPFSAHPFIRSETACYLSSSFAVGLAKKNNSRLHILHISTGKETNLFTNEIPLKEKRITSEACIHHLWFAAEDYKEKGAWIKWNPAVKTAQDREQIWQALLSDKIDVIATDHAPHTIEEKEKKYLNAPSGGPLAQHTLVAMLDFYHQGKISLVRIAEKMSHAVADCFQIKDRGYIREGYYADLVLVDIDKPWKVDRSNVLSKCGWSPFEGHNFKSSVEKVWVSGHLAYNQGHFDESQKGQRLRFNRD